MYGQMDEHGYSITTLHRMLSDLTHLFHGKLRKGGTVTPYRESSKEGREPR